MAQTPTVNSSTPGDFRASTPGDSRDRHVSPLMLLRSLTRRGQWSPALQGVCEVGRMVPRSGEAYKADSMPLGEAA